MISAKQIKDYVILAKQIQNYMISAKQIRIIGYQPNK